jgi:hypothetical protein
LGQEKKSRMYWGRRRRAEHIGAGEEEQNILGQEKKSRTYWGRRRRAERIGAGEEEQNILGQDKKSRIDKPLACRSHEHVLDDPANSVQNILAGRSGDRIPVGARFSASLQNSSASHPASCSMGIGTFPGIKRPGRDADPSPLLVPGFKQQSRAIPLLSLRDFVTHRMLKRTYLYIITIHGK